MEQTATAPWRAVGSDGTGSVAVGAAEIGTNGRRDARASSFAALAPVEGVDDVVVVVRVATDRSAQWEVRYRYRLANGTATAAFERARRNVTNPPGVFVERFNASAGGPVADALTPLAGERVVFVVAPGGEQFEGNGEAAAPVLLSVRSTPAVRFEQVRAGGSVDATVRLHLDAATARLLVTAPRPRQALAEAVRNETVTVSEGGS